MSALRVAAHAVELAGDGGIGVPSEADHDGQIDAFGEKSEHHFDPLGIGLEVVERRSEAGGEDLAAGLTLEARDMVVMTVADECMNSIIGDGAVATVGIWTGKAMRGNGLLASARAFGLRIGDSILLFDDMQVHLIAAKGAVIGRGRLPAALYEVLPLVVKTFPTAMKMLPDEYDDDQQQHVGDVGEIGHGYFVRWRQPVPNACQRTAGYKPE